MKTLQKRLPIDKICYKIKQERSAAGNIPPLPEIKQLRNHEGLGPDMALEGITHIASEHRYTPATAAKAVYSITSTASIGYHFITEYRCPL